MNSRKIIPLNINVPEIYSDESNLRNIVTDDNNRLWFAYNRTDIASYDLKSQKVKKYKILDERTALGGSNIIRLEYLPKDKIIISTNTGIFIFNTNTSEKDKLPSIANRQYDKTILNKVRN